MGVFRARPVRTYSTGATRDADDGKLDYEGFFSPRVLERRAQYMHTHRIQSDGELRTSDNWQKGIPKENYMKSLFRHFAEVWSMHRGTSTGDIEVALCAVMFNAEGYLHELLKGADAEELAFDRWQDSLPEAGHGLSGERSPAPSRTDDGRGTEEGWRPWLAQGYRQG